MKFSGPDDPCETLMLTEKLARNYKGALTAKQLAELLNISRKTVFKLAKAGRTLASALGLPYAST
jgi:excisionase family DNA binding protein